MAVRKALRKMISKAQGSRRELELKIIRMERKRRRMMMEKRQIQIRNSLPYLLSQMKVSSSMSAQILPFLRY